MLKSFESECHTFNMYFINKFEIGHTFVCIWFSKLKVKVMLRIKMIWWHPYCVSFHNNTIAFVIQSFALQLVSYTIDFAFGDERMKNIMNNSCNRFKYNVPPLRDSITIMQLNPLTFSKRKSNFIKYEMWMWVSEIIR